MTEKRFSEIVSTQKVIDNQTGKEYDCLIDDDLLKLLNELHEENKQLKSENKRLQGKASSWKITASEQIMEQSELMKENEQLRKQNQELIQGIQETAKISANGIAKPMVEKRWGKGVDYD